MREEMKKKPLSNIVAGLCLSVAVGVNTSTASAQFFEEIVVTAQKREQALSDVNLSVTAFSGDELDALGFSTSVDIAAQTPGLSIGTPVGEGNNPALALRGVGLNDFNDLAESTVSLYVDEVYSGALAGQTFQLFDIERVEVLRGPQGTLYGRNSTGGLVHFISKKPGEANDGYAYLNVGEYSLVELEVAQDLQISEGVAARVALAKKDHDGYVENRTGPDGNEADTLAYRVQLSADLNDNWNVLLNLQGGDADTVAPIYQVQATGPGGTDFVGSVDTDGDVFAGESDRNGVLDIETNGQTLTLTGSLSDNIVLTSITAASSVEKFHQEDTDASAVNFVGADFGIDYDQFTQEFRLNIASGENNYTVGAFYYTHDAQGFQNLQIFDGEVVDQVSDYDQDLESYAIFGQAEIALSETLGLTAGIRYTDEQKDFVYNNTVLVALDDDGINQGPIPIADNLQDSLDSSEVTGNIGLDFEISDTTSVYGLIARGFKAGGFNTGFGAGTQFDQEELTSYELGVKTSFGSTRLNASAFYYDYEDFQALSFNSDVGAGEIVNAPETTVYGAEIELVSNVTDNLLFSAGLSLVDSEIESIISPQGEVLIDRQLALTADVSANWLLRYHQDLASGSSLSYQVDGNYKSEHFFDVANQPVSRQGGYSVTNVRFGWTSEDEKLELSLWAKNLFEKEYLVYTFDFTGLAGFNQQFFGQPRWVGASARYSW